MAPEPIRRRFADLPHGQVHYREAGIGRGDPVLLLHSSPGSSRQLERLIAVLATDHHVIAPDTPGNGDSAPITVTTVADLAAPLLALLDILCLPVIHVYGMHTGAAIAAELALLAPVRVRSLAMEGVTSLDEATRSEYLARYAPPFVPDSEGGYLTRAFAFCRDQFLYFPWYEHSAATSRKAGLPNPEDLGALVLEVLKAGGTYSANYHAAFQWDAAQRLAEIACPMLLLASESDPLHAMTRAVAGAVHTFISLPAFAAPDYGTARRNALGALFSGAA